MTRQTTRGARGRSALAVALLSLCALLAVALTGRGVRAQDEPKGPFVMLAHIDDAITNSTADYIEAAVAEAQERGAQALVIEMDTLGGLLEATRRIVQTLLSAEVPIVTHVTPAGARAGSAGVFIVLASHVAAMAETSNIGAAHPVSAFGSDVEGDMGQKVLNDTAAWARSLAEARGRNVEWAEKAVRESASITAKEALEQNVIDVLAPDRNALLAALNGRNVTVGQRTVALKTQGVEVFAFERTAQQKLYDELSNPGLLYVLLLMGIFGIYIEFNHPGLIVPGLLGAVCLGIVFGLQILPINWFGAVLIGAAAVLFFAEVYVTSFGLLGLAGLGCLIGGSYILFSVPGSPFRVDPALIWTVSAAFALVLVAFGTLLMRAKRQGGTSGSDTFVGQHTQVVEAAAGKAARVFLDGTFWNATAEGELVTGQKVVVVGREGLTLKVRPLAPNEATLDHPADASG